MSGTGVDLAHSYYHEVVFPLLEARWPGLSHAAARLGSGSDVLGLDDDMSQDHDWGLRLNLLVHPGLVSAVDRYLAAVLPDQYRGLPVRFPVTWDPVERHRVQVNDPSEFLISRLGIDPLQGMSSEDWLALTSQSVLEVTAGAVFADTDGRLGEARRHLEWYPRDVWLYVVAAAWRRIAQDLPVMGRACHRGDSVTERLLVARLVTLIMQLGFLLERRWAPYPKWLASMFAELSHAGAILPRLMDCLSATSWQRSQEMLIAALKGTHALQRDVGLPTGDTVIEQFWDRPYPGVSESVVEDLLDAIDAPDLRRSASPLLGSIGQWCDSVDLLTDPKRRVRAARTMFRDISVSGRRV